MQAFVAIAPDHTATQLNRLSDTAFSSNSVVDKLHAKVFAIFIPESFFLNKHEQNLFWKNPKIFLESSPFDQVDVCVDGALIAEVAPTPNPTLSPAPASDGTALSATSVTITDTATDSVIYFTTDGSDPLARWLPERIKNSSNRWPELERVLASKSTFNRLEVRTGNGSQALILKGQGWPNRGHYGRLRLQVRIIRIFRRQGLRAVRWQN